MKYKIRKKVYYYGTGKDTSYYGYYNHDTGQWIEPEFDTREEAQAVIEKLGQGVYLLNHNEYERPSYRVLGRKA